MQFRHNIIGSNPVWIYVDNIHDHQHWGTDLCMVTSQTPPPLSPCEASLVDDKYQTISCHQYQWIFYLRVLWNLMVADEASLPLATVLSPGGKIHWSKFSIEVVQSKVYRHSFNFTSHTSHASRIPNRVDQPGMNQLLVWQPSSVGDEWADGVGGFMLITSKHRCTYVSNSIQENCEVIIISFFKR